MMCYILDKNTLSFSACRLGRVFAWSLFCWDNLQHDCWPSTSYPWDALFLHALWKLPQLLKWTKNQALAVCSLGDQGQWQNRSENQHQLEEMSLHMKQAHCQSRYVPYPVYCHGKLGSEIFLVSHQEKDMHLGENWKWWRCHLCICPLKVESPLSSISKKNPFYFPGCFLLACGKGCLCLATSPSHQQVIRDRGVNECFSFN